MSYNSGSGLYYNFLFDDEEFIVDPNIFSKFMAKSSILNLLPSITFSLVNTGNQFLSQKLATINKPINLEMSFSSSDKEYEVYKNFVIEVYHLQEAKINLEGRIDTMLTNKNSQKLVTSSKARGFKGKTSSEVVEEILKDYEFTSKNIEKSTVKGNWISPSIQSDAKFLKILKNRSISSDLSKMFMWIGFDGSFNMKSLNAMVKEKPALTLDLSNQDTTFYMPCGMNILNSGLRYNDEEVNTKYSEYVFKNTEDGKIVDLKKREYKKHESKHITIDKLDPYTTDQTYISGYSHDLLPSGYNSALYINSFINNPLTLTIRVRNIVQNTILPGKMITLKFPDGKEDYDLLFTGNYLITSVARMDTNNVYTTEFQCISCSVQEAGKDLFFNS